MSISATPTSAAAQVLTAAPAHPASSTDGSSGDVEGLAGQLGDLAAALRLAAQACESATDRVVPKRAGDARIARMYAEAATHWPGRSVPSRERFALALAELNRAAGAVRRAANEVEQAQGAVERLLRDNDPVREQ